MIFKSQQNARVDFESGMQIEVTAAGLFWVHDYLPRLREAVGLNEMAFVVNVKSMIYSVIL